MIALITGLLAGMLHVISGPDHLAALAPLAVKHPRRSWMTGLRWGLGHTAGVAIIGLIAVLTRDWLPLETISGVSERLVGVLLIGLGAWGIRKAFQIHSHEHRHGDHVHEHVHMHAASREHPTEHQHMHAALGIGALHGLAGSSHFLGVLPALALPSTTQAALYICAYGLGTVVAMTLFSSAVGAVAERFSTRTWKAYRALMFAASTTAVLVGALWLAL